MYIISGENRNNCQLCHTEFKMANGSVTQCRVWDQRENRKISQQNFCPVEHTPGQKQKITLTLNVVLFVFRVSFMSFVLVVYSIGQKHFLLICSRRRDAQFTLEVVLLDSSASSIPRGNRRASLEERGRIQLLTILRSPL